MLKMRRDIDGKSNMQATLFVVLHRQGLSRYC